MKRRPVLKEATVVYGDVPICINGPMILHRKDLRSVTVAGGSVARSLVTVAKEPVVLLHKSHPIMLPNFSRHEWATFARRQVLSPRAKMEVRRWNRNSRFSFNCHTLAVGDFVGLDPGSWLEGSSSIFTLMENPTRTLLDAFFREVIVLPRVGPLTDDVRDDDVVVFTDTSTGDLVHSGRVRSEKDQRLLLSKLGEHPAAISSLQDLAEQYVGQYDSVKVYRYRK